MQDTRDAAASAEDASSTARGTASVAWPRAVVVVVGMVAAAGAFLAPHRAQAPAPVSSRSIETSNGRGAPARFGAGKALVGASLPPAPARSAMGGAVEAGKTAIARAAGELDREALAAKLVAGLSRAVQPFDDLAARMAQQAARRPPATGAPRAAAGAGSTLAAPRTSAAPDLPRATRRPVTLIDPATLVVRAVVSVAPGHSAKVEVAGHGRLSRPAPDAEEDESLEADAAPPRLAPARMAAPPASPGPLLGRPTRAAAGGVRIPRIAPVDEPARVLPDGRGNPLVTITSSAPHDVPRGTGTPARPLRGDRTAPALAGSALAAGTVAPAPAAALAPNPSVNVPAAAPAALAAPAGAPIAPLAAPALTAGSAGIRIGGLGLR